MRFTKLAAAVAGIALGSTLSLAADKPAEKKDKVVKPTTTTNKPTDKAGQGGIILQNQGGRAADKGAQGGIILQNQGGKAADKGARGGIILQNQGGKAADKAARGGIILQNQGAAKAPAATGKTATQKTTGGTQ
jgi:ribosomal protein S20